MRSGGGADYGWPAAVAGEKRCKGESGAITVMRQIIGIECWPGCERNRGVEGGGGGGGELMDGKAGKFESKRCVFLGRCDVLGSLCESFCLERSMGAIDAFIL